MINNNENENEIFYLLSEQSLDNILNRLYQLVKENKTHIIDEAINVGFNINVQDYTHKNLLFYFQEHTDQTGYELIDYLIMKGLDTTHLDLYHLNPFHYLVFCPETIELLIFSKINPSNQDTRTPISVIEQYKKDLNQLKNSKVTKNKIKEGRKSISLIEKSTLFIEKQQEYKINIL